LAQDLLSAAVHTVGHAEWRAVGDRPTPMASESGEHRIWRLDVRMPDGRAMELEPPVRSENTVLELRRRLGAALGIQEEQVSLVHGSGELLQDMQRLGEVSAEEPEELRLTALRRPCRVRPAEYLSHINRGAGGLSDAGKFALKVGSGLSFPAPQGININMMPFIMGARNSVPEEYQHYWHIIQQCCSVRDIGRVCYLTIHESFTKKGESQRRPGLHVESSMVTMTERGRVEQVLHHWGFSLGCERQGGLFMGSNVDRSCRIWNCSLAEPEKVVGRLGDIEHLRDDLGEGVHMEAGEVWWLTDVTPHESLPLEKDEYRQYFRVVTSSVSIWYAKHSTPNRLGVCPDPAVTEIVMHDKFVETGLSGGRGELDKSVEAGLVPREVFGKKLEEA